MTISEWMKSAQEAMAESGCPDPAVDARWIAEDVLHMTAAELQSCRLLGSAEGIPFLEEDLPLFEGKTPYWMPVIGMRGWDIQVFRPRMFPDNYATHLVYDALPVIQYDSMIQKGWFDLDWEFVPQAGGATVHPGKPKVPSMVNWEDYIELPDIDALDWEGSAKENRGFLDTDNVRQIAFLSCLWERLISLMDVENAAVALIDEDEKEGVHRFFDKLCIMYDKMIEYSKKYYNIDMVLWHDDWGTQKSTFFSPAVHKEKAGCQLLL